MSLADMFKSVLAPAAPAPAPATPPGVPVPGNITKQDPTQVSATTAPNGTIPAQPAPVPTEPPSPLAEFKDIWQPDPNAIPASAAAGFNIDPAKMFEAAKKTDFSRFMNPENLKAIAAGGEGAVKAMMDTMNGVAQAAYGQSAVAAAKIVEAALAKNKETFDAALPGLIRKHQVSDTLRTENPIFNNPAIQPIISALESQLMIKHPQATAAQINAEAKKYVEALGSSFAPKLVVDAATAAKAKNEVDWTNFLS